MVTNRSDKRPFKKDCDEPPLKSDEDAFRNLVAILKTDFLKTGTDVVSDQPMMLNPCENGPWSND